MKFIVKISLLLVIAGIGTATCQDAFRKTTQSDEFGQFTVLDLQRKVMLTDETQVAVKNWVNDAPAAAAELRLLREQSAMLADIRKDILKFTRGWSVSKPSEITRQRELDFIDTVESKLKGILSEVQRRRLNELELQKVGAFALLRGDVRRKLNLTAAQCLRIRDAISDTGAQSAITQAEPSGQRFGRICYGILNETQLTVWTEMIGEQLPALIKLAPLDPPEIEKAPKSQVARRMTSNRPTLDVVVTPSRLRNQVVRAELKLADEQLERLSKSYQELDKVNDQLKAVTPPFDERYLPLTLERNRCWAAYQKEFREVLNSSQLRRIREIEFQAASENALLSRDFREAARLSDEQINTFDQLFRDRRTLYESQIKNAANASLRDLLVKEANFRMETVMIAVQELSDSQLSIWERMTGPVVTVDGLFDESESPNQ